MTKVTVNSRPFSVEEERRLNAKGNTLRFDHVEITVEPRLLEEARVVWEHMSSADRTWFRAGLEPYLEWASTCLGAGRADMVNTEALMRAMCIRHVSAN